MNDCIKMPSFAPCPNCCEALRVLLLALEESPTTLTTKQRQAWEQAKEVLLSKGAWA